MATLERYKNKHIDEAIDALLGQVYLLTGYKEAAEQGGREDLAAIIDNLVARARYAVDRLHALDKELSADQRVSMKSPVAEALELTLACAGKE